MYLIHRCTPYGLLFVHLHSTKESPWIFNLFHVKVEFIISGSISHKHAVDKATDEYKRMRLRKEL